MRIKLSSFLQLRFNVYLYQRLSWKINLYYLLFLGAIYFLINRKEKDKISNSVEQVFGGYKNKEEIARITKNVFQGILFHYYEKIYNAYENIEKLIRFFQNCINSNSIEKIENALSKGKGVIFVTGHYGAIEYIPIFLAQKQYPVSAVVKFATQQLENTTYEKTKDIGIKIINAEKEENVLKVIMRELKQNRIIFFECDEIEEWKPSKKEEMWFLGKRIGVDRTIDLIQRRSGAEVLFGLLHRENLKQYNLLIADKEEMKKTTGKGPCSFGRMILKNLEQYIYTYPEEWYQWKNYLQIESNTDLSSRADKPSYIGKLQPTYVELI